MGLINKFMKIIIETECGEKTCASTPGHFCRFVGTKHLGASYYCLLFNTPLYDGSDGWLHRCQECLDKFHKNV